MTLTFDGETFTLTLPCGCVVWLDGDLPQRAKDARDGVTFEAGTDAGVSPCGAHSGLGETGDA